MFFFKWKFLINYLFFVFKNTFLHSLTLKLILSKCNIIITNIIGKYQAGKCGHNDRQQAGRTDSRLPVAVVLLTEAHVTVATPLGHADMAHHEEVDVQVVCTGAAHCLVF